MREYRERKDGFAPTDQCQTEQCRTAHSFLRVVEEPLCEQWVQGGEEYNERCIPVDTGVGQASREILDEEVAKEPACGHGAVRRTLSSSNPLPWENR